MKFQISLLLLIFGFGFQAGAASGTISKVSGTKAIVQFDQSVKAGDKVQSASAGTGTITKVSGTKAIVQFNQTPKAGEKVQSSGELTGNPSEDLDGITPAPQLETASALVNPALSRRNAFEYSWVTTSLTVNGNSNTSTAANLIYWFNFQQYEIAGIGQLLNNPGSAYIGLGGIGQWDFVQNKPGTTIVPGAFAKLLFNIGTGASNGTLTTLGIGGSADWFPFMDRVAFNLSLEYDTISVSTGGGTLSQLVFSSGVKIYL